MPTAVVRVVVDAEGRLSQAEYYAAVKRLRSSGYEVVVSESEHLPATNREVELIVDGGSPEDHARACGEAFGTDTRLGVVTYISRGTDDDARGVLRRFGVPGEVRREVQGEEDVVVVTIARPDLGRVPESRLHTALEAALNTEVRILTV